MSSETRHEGRNRSEPLTVGGQALIEGVMVRAPEAWAVAARRLDGVVVAERRPLPRLSTRTVAAKIPFLRGILVLVESLNLGFRSLAWSAEVASQEPGEESGTIEGPAEKLGWKLWLWMGVAMGFFVAFFMVVPATVARWTAGESGLLFGFLEAVIRMGLFIGYIWGIGRMADIKRVFSYHGAEHMTIHAYEQQETISVESIAKYPPEHPRCGTNFLLIVVILSIVAFALVGNPGWLVLVASRVLFIPLIAAVAYELLKFAGKRQSQTLGRLLALPGIWLQKLTTNQPDSDQIEVAMTALLSAVEPAEADRLLGAGTIPPSVAEAVAK
ncbi:MAG: DUF1385 domain-containing protein [bacterium]|nr:DUF1385 domain-containing protein [Acidimicrobiia bacterium]MCY4651482.1 DUF1385 domain-containing protein [bacterium]